MSILQEKLDFLLDKYAVANKATLTEDGKCVTVAGKTYPILPWRSERRFAELKKMVDTKTVGSISHFKIMSLNPKTVALDEVLLRELDTAEFIGSLAVTQIFKAENGPAASVICMTDKEAVITLELSNNLKEGAEVIDKHEIITDRGTACDRAMDSQTPLYSLYVYGEETAEYTDVDFELYGLTAELVAIVRGAFDIAKNPALGEENQAVYNRLLSLVEAASLSAEKCENVIL
ncbi:MAG: hypothetical protein IJY71_00990 [Clostridia bacterium]|nr:hypothetical protein [Clostridia bacterium]